MTKQCRSRQLFPKFNERKDPKSPNLQGMFARSINAKYQHMLECAFLSYGGRTKDYSHNDKNKDSGASNRTKD